MNESDNALLERLMVVSVSSPASGKTTLAESLARRLGWVHISSDVVRKELSGPAATEKRTSKLNTRLYTAAMTKRT